jgi:hypothetical protein
MTTLDELRERLKDPDATFTSEEVNKLLEDTERKALMDSYNQARIAAATQAAQEGLAVTKACAEQMLAQWSNDTTPALVEVTA